MKSFILIVMISFIMKTTLTVTSPAFSNNGAIPLVYSCKGLNINPPLSIGEIPPGAKSLALIVDDPDAPKGTFDHWVMWNIPVTSHIDERSAPGVQGLNGKKENSYTGPCPPEGTHHYHFKVYALDRMLDLVKETDKAGLEKAMKDHVLAEGELTGLFGK